MAVASIASADSSSTTTCALSSTPCLSFQNTSSGSAVNFQSASGFGSRGTSKTGIGLQGKTASGNVLYPGVEGESTNNDGTDVAGGFGLSGITGTAPAYGVYALGSQTGVYGRTTASGTQSAYSAGVEGIDLAGGSANAFNIGVYGYSAAGIGVFASANPGSFTFQNSRQTGVLALAFSGIAIEAVSPQVPMEVDNPTTGDLIDVATTDGFFVAYNENVSNSPVTQFDRSGNEFLSGSLFVNGETVPTPIDADPAHVRMTYGSQSTAATLEDDGEARLSDGSAIVRLDPTLRGVVDSHAPYAVSLTPEGESNGLYVAQKTPDGFVVRESHAGRSTIAFAYRIVARPRDANDSRLARDHPQTTPRANRMAIGRSGTGAARTPERLVEQRPADKAPDTTNATVCSNATTPCVTYQNTSSGSAVNFQGTSSFGSRASSTSGTGLEGKSASGSMLAPALDGESETNSGSDAAGAFGLDGAGGTAPAYGVYALGTASGIYAETTAPGTQSAISSAIEGDDISAKPSSGVDMNVGVIGYSPNYGAGVIGAANTQGGLGNTGLVGAAHQGQYAGSFSVGVEAVSDSTALEATNSSNADTFEVLPGSYLFLMSGKNGSAVCGKSGNCSLSGYLETQDGEYVRTRSADGVPRVAFGARTSAPLIEDDGEARLERGQATVHIDSDLAGVVDRRTSYSVFLTPEGNSKGLYVSSKSADGFTVREAHGGTSSLGFAYRIVARPVGERATRLAHAEPRFEPRITSNEKTGALRPLEPLERLKRRLGPQRYAEALRAFVALEGKK